MSSLVFWWILLGIPSGAFCAYIAGQKNREGLSWFVLGFCFPLLALIAVASVPPLASGPGAPRSAGSVTKFGDPDVPAPWNCPSCKTVNAAETFTCVSCGLSLR